MVLVDGVVIDENVDELLKIPFSRTNWISLAAKTKETWVRAIRRSPDVSPIGATTEDRWTPFSRAATDVPGTVKSTIRTRPTTRNDSVAPEGVGCTFALLMPFCRIVVVAPGTVKLLNRLMLKGAPRMLRNVAVVPTEVVTDGRATAFECVATVEAAFSKNTARGDPFSRTEGVVAAGANVCALVKPLDRVLGDEATDVKLMARLTLKIVMVPVVCVAVVVPFGFSESARLTPFCRSVALDPLGENELTRAIPFDRIDALVPGGVSAKMRATPFERTEVVEAVGLSEVKRLRPTRRADVVVPAAVKDVDRFTLTAVAPPVKFLSASISVLLRARV
jgi:hypothetical protein